MSRSTPIVYSTLIQELEAPEKAVVPKTPIGLLPFISKTNILWNSEMETPKNKLEQNYQNYNKIIKSVNNEETSHLHQQYTPKKNKDNTKSSKMDNTSPVLGGQKRRKGRMKHKILNQIILDFDNNNDQQNTFSTNSKKISSKTTKISSNELTLDITAEVKSTLKKYNNLNSMQYKEIINVEEFNSSNKNSEISTQDFFSNATFSCIDQLCSNVIKEGKVNLASETNEVNTNINDKSIKEEFFNKNTNKTMNMSNNITERVAAIRRNQKLWKQPINTDTVILKDVFSKLDRELELADVEFTVGKRKVLNTENNSLEHSFEKLLFVEDEAIITNNKIIAQKNKIGNSSQFVPIEIMDDWDADNVLDNQKENMNVRNIPDSSITTAQILENGNFHTANGKGIIVNEEYIKKSLKMYNEIEDDIKNSKSSLNLKKSYAKLNLSKRSFDSFKNNKDLISYKANLFDNNNYDSNSLSLDGNFNNITVKLSSVNSKHTHISKNSLLNHTKENQNLNKNECNELRLNKWSEQTKQSDVSFHKQICDQEKKSVTIICNKKSLLDSLIGQKCTNEIAIEALDNNGFITAGGKVVQINKEKENFYLGIFNNLGEDCHDEINFLNIKKNSRGNLKIKSSDKATIIFNKKRENVAVESKCDKHNKKVIYSNKIDLKKMNNFSNKKKGLENENINAENHFIIPNSIHTLKKINETSTAILNTQKNINKKNVCINAKEHMLKHNQTIFKKKLKEETRRTKNEKILKSKQNFRHMNKLIHKLDNYEVKKSERCRSFNGFTVNNGNTTSKLNKSNPLEESFMNQPLKNGLSISQCFDPHSDSWLSKLEISHFNYSKEKSPDLDVKIEDKLHVCVLQHKSFVTEQSNEFFGFSYKECTENIRQYINFKRFLEKQNVNNSIIKLKIDSDQTISFCNKTTSTQHLVIQCKNNVYLKKNYNESTYAITEIKSNIFINEKNYFNELKINQEYYEKKENIIEKRKYADTDSDTPLSTLKKPRIGNKLQGRKLFNDEISGEDYLLNYIKNQKSPTSLNVLTFTDHQNKDLLKNRLQAILCQEEIIKNKKNIKIKPKIGSLLQQRILNNKNRISWDELVGNSVPFPCSIQEIRKNHPDERILDVTASNAMRYKFSLSNKIGHKRVISLNVGDSGSLIFDENGHAGVSEFTKSFLAIPSVDLKILPIGWIDNHYKWIIWKLASIDRIRFNTIKLPKMLTPERVFKELKYRYDREIDKAERPVLRKILEKDDVSTRRVILCISLIKQNPNKQYTAKGFMDLPQIEATDGWYSIPLMIDNAMANFIAIGKIKEGTKIVTYGAELLECSKGYFPLEKPANVRLKIHTNCTRRARWNAKLGNQKNSGPIPVKLKDIIPSGGMIGATTAVVARIYPLLYRETTINGQIIYRNSLSEEKATSDYERNREGKVNTLHPEAEKNFIFKKTLKFDESVENFQALKTRIESGVFQDLSPPRQDSAILKVRLFHDQTTATLSICGSNEDVGYGIKEGDTITIHNSFALGTRGGELNLMANRITEIKKEKLLKLSYPGRTCISILEICTMGFEPVFNEIDTVGVVVSSRDIPHGMKNFEMVNLAHPKPTGGGSAFLSILFWGGLSSFGYERMLAVGSFVACSNLEWRRGACWSVAVAYCSERSIFTCHPRQPHLITELRNLKALVQDPVMYVKNCTEEVLRNVSKRLQPRTHQVDMVSPRAANLQLRSPCRSSIRRRLEKLSHYGCPTDSSASVDLNDSSDRVKRDFTPLMRKM